MLFFEAQLLRFKRLISEHASVLVWILSLACLSVGARNFEEGLSLDASLYATIARNIARSGQYFLLDGQVPEFRIFAEHPHLGFWIQALIYKVLPIADWSTRIQGHIFYLLFMFLFFRVSHSLFSLRTSVLAVLFLWVWPVFSNFFSSFYLDPGCLVFGSLFLVAYAKGLGLSFDKGRSDWVLSSRSRRSWVFLSLVSGLFLGLAFMQKGMTALGFGPVAAVLLALALLRGTRVERRRIVVGTLLSLGVCMLVLTAYYGAILRSAVPQFLDIYWSRQFSNRFSKGTSFAELFSAKFWGRLKDDTLQMLWLLAPALYLLRRSWKASLLPFAFFASFVLLYGLNRRIGAQYWLMIMPGLALILAAAADLVLNRFPRAPQAPILMRATQMLAISALMLVQYLPTSTHHVRRPPQSPFLQQLQESQGYRDLVVIGKRLDFVFAASFAWYADYRVHYLTPKHFLSQLHNNNLASFETPAVYLLLDPELRKTSLAPPQGYCKTEDLLHPCSK